MPVRLLLALLIALLPAPGMASRHDAQPAAGPAGLPLAASRPTTATLAAVSAAARDNDHAALDTPAPAPAPTLMPAPSQDQAQRGASGPQKPPLPRPGCFWGGYFPVLDEEAQDTGAHIVTRICSPLNGSGTARLPPLDAGRHGPRHGIRVQAGDWTVMAHGILWGIHTEQGGPRGDDMAFVKSMAMLDGETMLGENTRLQLRSILSLEPLMGSRGYPNLFATGETSAGAPLVGRQHPHDLFMELAGRVDFYVAEGRSLFIYGGPVGEPALGPSAFLQRRSARYLALAPITHHWFDGTHITYGVLTAGFAHPAFQIEASAFRGREPDAERWNIERPKLDSWSVRASLQPSSNWLMQVSHGRLESPEALHGGVDESRTTASVHYASETVSAMLAFSAKNRLPGATLTAWLGEANWDLTHHHSLFGRVENAADDELFPDPSHPLHDRRFRITRFEAGYAYRLPLGSAVGLALGGSAMAYAKPAALDPYYGDAPLGWTAFAKLSLGD